MVEDLLDPVPRRADLAEGVAEVAPDAGEARPGAALAAKQKGADKTSRIPIKVVHGAERLRKPEWIRVKLGADSSRFNQVNWFSMIASGSEDDMAGFPVAHSGAIPRDWSAPAALSGVFLLESFFTTEF